MPTTQEDPYADVARHGHPYVTITAGDYTADISTLGGGPRSFEYRGRPLLVDYPRGVHPPLNSGVILAPWPNRVADGVFIHDGEVHRLEITEPGRANAIHGFVGELPWEIARAAADSVTLRLALDTRPGWPWPLLMELTWFINASHGLSVEITTTNLGDTDCPFGLGFHPYLSAGGARLDDCSLTVDATGVLPLEPVRNLPAGPEIPVDRVVPGLADGVSANGLWLDHCFATGRSVAGLTGPDGFGVTLWADEHFPWCQVFTADPARREGYPGVGRAVAVEPMTCPPDALRSGRDLVRIEPGASLSRTFGLHLTTE